MEDAKKRLEILIDNTLQVLDHMVVDSEYNEMLQSIKSGLSEQKRKAAAFSNNTNEELKNEALAMTKTLSEINNKVQELETNLMEDYKKSTGNQIEAYENLSIDEQREQAESYHDKIDYLSAVKVRENINDMNEILSKIMS